MKITIKKNGATITVEGAASERVQIAETVEQLYRDYITPDEPSPTGDDAWADFLKQFASRIATCLSKDFHTDDFFNFGIGQNLIPAFFSTKHKTADSAKRTFGKHIRRLLSRTMTDTLGREFVITKRECAKGAIYTLRFLAAESTHARAIPARGCVTNGPGFTHWRDFQPIHG